LYLGEPGESDERNDCLFTGFLGAFLSSPKGPFTIPIPDQRYGNGWWKDSVARGLEIRSCMEKKGYTLQQ